MKKTMLLLIVSMLCLMTGCSMGKISVNEKNSVKEGNMKIED